MDVQRKKGVLDVCVLSVLKMEASYGYQIKVEVSRCIEISESTLYPILKRLEASGCLTTYQQEHNGRMRRYYRITEAGISRIEDFINEWDEMKKIYSFVEKNSMEVTINEEK